MQKLRPYVLPGLFAFHLVTLCVLFAAVSRQNEAAAVMAGFTILSQFFLTALFAGLGTGSWSLRIPSWAALAALSWFCFVVLMVHAEGGRLFRSPEMVWALPLAPPIGWIVLVSLLLCLRGIPFFKWRIALQPTSPDLPSSQNSLTRGILIVVATWAGVLSLLKDSWRWSETATVSSGSTDVLLMVSGIAALVGAGALVVTVLAVGLTLTRLADWMFYRRRWTLPLLVAAVVSAGLLLVLNDSIGSERPLLIVWILVVLATQPLTTLLVMGMAGYRLAPRKQSEFNVSEPAAQAAAQTTAEPVEAWLPGLQRAHFVAPIGVLLFFVAFVPTGTLNRHSFKVRFSASLRSNADGSESLRLNEQATNDSLRALSTFDKLKTLDLTACNKITDAGLVHLKGMNLKTLDILQLVATDTGLKYYLAAIEPRSVLDLRGWSNPVSPLRWTSPASVIGVEARLRAVRLAIPLRCVRPSSVIPVPVR